MPNEKGRAHTQIQLQLQLQLQLQQQQPSSAMLRNDTDTLQLRTMLTLCLCLCHVAKRERASSFGSSLPISYALALLLRHLHALSRALCGAACCAHFELLFLATIFVFWSFCRARNSIHDDQAAGNRSQSLALCAAAAADSRSSHKSAALILNVLVVVSNWFYVLFGLWALGIFHCVSKFNLIFIFARRSLSLSLIVCVCVCCFSLRSQPALVLPGILFICVILIYSARTIVLLLRQCDDGADVCLCNGMRARVYL